MELDEFIKLLKKLLAKKEGFKLELDCKNDGTISLSNFKSNIILQKLLTDEKE